MSATANLSHNEVSVTGELDTSLPQTVLHLGSGRTVVVPTALLLSGTDSEQIPRPARIEQAGAHAGGETVIPLVSEQLQVGKETVTTGKVRLHRGVETFTDSVGLSLTRTGWEVERNPVGEIVAEKPEVRQEGDVMIFPLVEERLVARREYFLIEEVRVRQVATTTERTASLELQRDVLTMEREES